MDYKLKTIGFIAAGMIALSACTPQQASKSYTVEGVVADSSVNGKTIYIMRYDNNRYIDSTVIANGRFTFQGKTDSAYFCRIDVNYDEFANFILEPGSIQVDLKAHSNPSGTPRNAEMVRLNNMEDSLREVTASMWESIQQQYKEEDERDEAMKKALDEQAQRIADWADAYFKPIAGDGLGLYFLYTPMFDSMPSERKKALLQITQSWIRSSRMVNNLINNIDAQSRTKEGMPYTDIEGTDAEGNPIALSDYVGKGDYVLVDAWSSWCGPCIGEIPYLKELYDTYKGKGLTIVGIFTWDEASNLKSALKEHGIAWPQIVAREAMQKLYGIDGIPHIMLIAPDGTILKRNLRGENMVKTVEKALKDKAPAK